MSYVKQRNPARHAAGVGIVIALHVVIVYALLTGLANRVIEVVRQPVEAMIVDTPKPPPPPPVETVKPPPKELAKPKTLALPPPVRTPYVRPPEVAVPTPPSQNAIAAQSVDPTPTPPAVPAPRVASASRSASVGVVCPNSDQVRAAIRYPREALRDGITGNVVIEFTVSTDGAVKDLSVAQSADPVLDRAAENAVKQFKCVAQGEDVRVQVPFAFNLN